MTQPLYENRIDWLKENIRFFGMFLKDPQNVGAFFPSSRDLTQAMIQAAGELSGYELIVELGVGSGALTSHLGEVMSPAHDFFAMELNPVFAEQVQAALPDMTIYQDSAAHIHRYLDQHDAAQVDVMFSGIPWANLPEPLQLELLGALHDALADQGYFITFAYIHSYFFASSIRFRELLTRQFGSFKVSPIVWRNFPPAVIYICKK